MGESLVKIRVKQKLELHEVATLLRLPSRTISNIEQGHYHAVPVVYLKGHVQRYINLLSEHDKSLQKVDLDALINAARSSNSATQPEVKLLSATLPALPQHRLFDKVLRVASYLVVTAGVVIPLVWWFTQGAVRMSFDESLISNNAPTEMSNLQTADQPDTIASIRPGHLNASAAPFASMRPVRSSGPQDLSASGQVLLPNTLRMQTAWPGTVAQSSPQPPYRYHDAELGLELAPGTPYKPDAPNQLALRMLNDSWVEITAADGKRVEFDLLKTGNLHEYQVQLPLDILIGKASAVDLMFNGQVVDLSPHTRGNVAKLHLGASE